MKNIVHSHLQTVLKQRLQDIPALLSTPISISYSYEEKHGDLSSNIALILAKSLKCSPYQLAQEIVALLMQKNPNALFEKIEVAGPGFINFFLKKSSWHPIISQILTQKEQYGHSDFGNNQKLLLEFISSNPTGPLHVGHGRTAAYGDVLLRVLKAVGYSVYAEYYVNDAGRQMDIMTVSVWLRYLEDLGETIALPSNAYQGDYIKSIALQLQTLYKDKFYHIATSIQQQLPINSLENKEVYIDALIAKAKALLGKDSFQQIRTCSLDSILSDIKNDIEEFDVHFDNWFFESSVIQDGYLKQMLTQLKNQGYTYEAQGNLWFRSTEFGDDKDRVLLRANGQPTYFAVDAAYHWHILKDRKFTHKMTVLGADHHGYIARIRAVVEALGYQADHTLSFSIIQFVSLYEGKTKIPMSTRSGEFITLRQLRKAVGNDAARLFFVLRKVGQPLDFDLALAQSKSHDNPVYYLQYAYARMCSIMRQLNARGLSWSLATALTHLSHLESKEEIDLLKQLSQYPEIVLQTAKQYEPALLTQYLRELAQSFHSYYNHTPFLIEASELRHARLALMQAIQQVLKNGFDLLGVNALTSM